MRMHGVRSLLMGGQACVFYGAAEFSRDVDFALMADEENLKRLNAAMKDLRAEVVAVPPFEQRYLELGLAVHFRCQLEGVEGFRVDVMSRMRGVDPFPELWERRTTIEIDGNLMDLLSLPDLVKAKKTQRSKDWPMIQRLVEANWFQNQLEPNHARVEFWLKECRTPQLLLRIVKEHPEQATRIANRRPLLLHAIAGEVLELDEALECERKQAMAEDKSYWQPLKKEIERLRIQRRIEPGNPLPNT
jgi:hypothetical protein